MPAKDKFHDAVKIALEKDGWTVTDENSVLVFDGDTVTKDIGAEKGEKLMAVKIVHWGDTNFLDDFAVALG